MSLEFNSAKLTPRAIHYTIASRAKRFLIVKCSLVLIEISWLIFFLNLIETKLAYINLTTREAKEQSI